MSLREELAGFRAQVETMVPAADLQVAWSEIAAWAPSEASARVGAAAATFTLPDAYGTSVSLAALLARGPVVLSFYRGEWCPYCNLELRALQAQLPAFEKHAATLVAVSPEKPDHARDLIGKERLAFPVLTDAGNVVARSYGLLFPIAPAFETLMRDKFGADMALRNADGRWELPVPATLVIGRDGRIVFAHVDPDFTRRADPETILAVLAAIDLPQVS